MGNLTVVEANQIVAEKKAQLVKCQSAMHGAKNRLALVEASLSHIVESGELDIDLIVALSEETGILKDVFASIEMDLSLED